MKQTQTFNAEIKKLLDLMIHSLYSNKEIFLRELISNASDAMDKLKFEALTQHQLLSPNHNYEIRLVPNKDAHTLKIIDSGIGMTKEEVVEYIGTIARSGTQQFQKLSQEMKSKPEMIGQFGVGFYSSFMVAEKVTLHTQKAGSQMGVVWESSGDGTYSIDEVPRPEGTGTTITLNLKKFSDEEDVADFSDEWTLKSLVKKYSDFISFPIIMKKITEKTEDEASASASAADDAEESKQENLDKSEKSEKSEKSVKTMVETDETLNSMKAIWLKPAAEVTPTEYNEFYKHISHDWNDPLKTVHYKAEGTLEFNSLLFFPAKKPFNAFHKDAEYGLSLYVKRVFIMSDCKNLIPSHLRFVKGLVDSSDLSLNVSREILQQDKQVQMIKKNVVNKIYSSLKDMLTQSREQYETFWKEFGAVFKEGIPNDYAAKDKMQDLLLFQSSTQEKWTTLEEYVARMKPEQKDIYFITGDSLSHVKSTPYLEKLNEKGFEVLYCVDPIDEWVMNTVTQYKEKKLQSITRDDLNLDSEEQKKKNEEEHKSLRERFSGLIDVMKSSLNEQIKDVVISDRLSSTPACLVNSANDPSANMERILSKMGSDYSGPKSKRIMELNLKHPLFEVMAKRSAEDQKTWAEILFNQALLNEGSELPDPVRFSKHISNLMAQM